MADVSKTVLTKFEAATRDYVREIANMEEANEEVTKSTGQASKAVDTLNNELSNTAENLGLIPPGASRALGSVKNLTTGMKGLKVAIAATGIGALLVALGSLVTFLTQSQRGQERLNVILGVAKGIFGEVTNIVTDLGEVLFTAFTSPQEAVEMFRERFTNLINIINAGGELIWKALSGQWKDLGDSWDNFSLAVSQGVDNWTDAVDRGLEAGKAENELLRARQGLIVTEARLRNEISELVLRSRDETIDVAEREADIVKAQEIQKTLGAERLRVARLELAAAQQAADLAPNDIEANNKLLELRASILQINKENNDQLRELVNRQTEMNNKVEAERKARADSQEFLFEQQERLNKSTDKGLKTNEDLTKDLVKRSKDVDAMNKKATDRANEREAREKQAFENEMEYQQARAAGQAEIFAGAAALASEFGVLEKEFAIAQAVINTYQAASTAIATYPPPFGQIAAAIAVAFGLAQVAKISGVGLPGGGSFEYGGLIPWGGGMIRGRSHAHGGVKFSRGGFRGEAQGGEFIVNRDATARNLGLLQHINATGKYQAGGMVPGLGGFNTQIAQLSGDLSSVIGEIPQSVLVTEDLSKTQNRVNVTESRATLSR